MFLLTLLVRLHLAPASYGQTSLPGLASLSFNPSAVRAGSPCTGTVTLTGPAPSGGATVTLKSLSTAATVPASVFIQPYAVSATFPLTTQAAVFYANYKYQINASYNGTILGAILTVTSTTRPYGGLYGGVPVAVAATASTRIEAENYDLGGEGFGYHDVANGGQTAYRTDNIGVYADAASSNGYAVGWAAGGEWDAYTLNVAAAGVYNPTAFVGSTIGGGTFHLEFGPLGQIGGTGVTRSAEFTALNTSGSTPYCQPVRAAGVSLPAGLLWMRLVVDSAYPGNFDVFTLAPAPVLTSIVVTPATATLSTGGCQPFTAVANDQNGKPLSPQPAIAWTSTGVGAITPAGLYSAGTTAGTATVTAASGSVTGTAAVTVNSSSSAPVLSLTATATGANKVTLYWNGISGASGYNVYRSTVSGGPYTQIAQNVAQADPGPGMAGSFMYSDTAGLTTGTDYFYVVWAVQSGVETLQSNEADSVPDPSAIAWDSGNAVQIVSQVQAMVANNLASDEPAVGELTIGGPNGVIYQSFQNGSPAQAYAAPGHYSVSNHTLVYADGNEVPAPIDTSDSDPGVPAVSSSTGQSATTASATASLKFKQSLGHLYNSTTPPSGIFREVQTQPGYSSLLSYVGLPDVMDTTLSNIDGRPYDPKNPSKPNSSKFPGSDTGYIYTGGTAYTTVTGKNGTTTYQSELDAGLMLFRTGDAAHPGWVPVINPPTGPKVFEAGFVGYPLEADTAAVGAGCNIFPPVFVSGEPLMSFKAAGYGTIPDGIVVMSIHAETNGNVFRLINGVRTQVGDITLVRGGE